MTNFIPRNHNSLVSRNYDILERMHKILLAILLFVVFFFLRSEVFAKSVPRCTDQPITNANYSLQKGEGHCPNDTASTEYVCYKPTAETPGLGLAGKAPYTCYKLRADADAAAVAAARAAVDELGDPGPKAGAAGAAPAVKVCTPDDKDCTKGGGKRCNTATGVEDPKGNGILTAIGCVPTEPKTLVEGLLKYGTVAAGAIAFLLMLLGAIGMITAEGNPEVIKNSQERFYAAIIGLLFIIFAVLLMQVIGVDILGLPGFER